MLKQEPRAWYTRIDNYFTGLGFTKNEADVNLYHIMVEGKPLIIVLYVDDLISTGNNQLIREFEMKDMDLMHYFLGMEVQQKDGEVFLSQGEYTNEILSEHTTRFVLCGEQDESRYGSTYHAILEGSEACAEIPQRHILVWIVVQMDRGSEAQGFTDADWVGSPSDQKNTFRRIFNLGSAAVS
eukprot:PITA_04839